MRGEDMKKIFGRGNTKSKLQDDPDFDEKLRMRRELGIQGLPEGEALMNTAAFSRMQIDAALSQAKADAGDTASGADEVQLEETTPQPPTADADRCRAAGPPASPVELAALERDMMSAKERNVVTHLALRVATYYARSAAIFGVDSGLVAGLGSAGDGTPGGIEAIMIPMDADSLICRPISTGKPARKRTPLGEVDGRVLRALGRSDAKEVLVLPVQIAERVVNLLYVDNGPEPLPDTSVGALRVLAVILAKAYERVGAEATG
jgi:hypothetical protein